MESIEDKKDRRQIVVTGVEEVKRLQKLIDFISEINGSNKTAVSAINWITKRFEMGKITFLAFFSIIGIFTYVV